MAIFTSIRNVLNRNAEQLQHERGFFAEAGYALNKTLADLTPDTTYGSTATHLKLAAVSLGETLKAAGGGIKSALWDEKNKFVREIVHQSGVKNPIGQAGLAIFYTGLYYVNAFTVDAVVGIGKGLIHGGKTIANAATTEEALLGVGEVYGSVGAAAGMVAGGMKVPQMASKIGHTTFVVPMLNGAEATLATATIPTGFLVAGAMPGGIGIVMMSASGGSKQLGSGKPHDFRYARFAPNTLEKQTYNSILDELEVGNYTRIAELREIVVRLIEQAEESGAISGPLRSLRYQLKQARRVKKVVPRDALHDVSAIEQMIMDFMEKVDPS